MKTIARQAALGCLLATLSTPAPGQSLSPSELAALSQRAATVEEQTLHRTSCATVSGTPTGDSLTVAPGLSGDVNTLPALDLLPVIDLVYEGAQKGTFAIAAYPELPNGGIGGKDFCGASELSPVSPALKEGDVLRSVTLVLRPGLDLASAYPNTSVEIFQRGQLIALPAGPYLRLAKSDAVSDWFQSSGQRWASDRGYGPWMTLGDWHYLFLGNR